MMGAGAGAAVGAAAVSGAAKVEISARMLKKAPAQNFTLWSLTSSGIGIAMDPAPLPGRLQVDIMLDCNLTITSEDVCRLAVAEVEPYPEG